MNKDFMKRAIALAKRGKGKTSPNPCVGAVIVKGGRIVSEGWHKMAGGPHAEIVAIDSLMKKSGVISMEIDPMLFANADLYVTLEPCCHKGKTGPCVDSIIKAGFRKVFIGMKDPFKKVNGKGLSALKKAGIKVELCKEGSDLAKTVRDLNQPFIKWAQAGVPYVVLKAGMSLDGRIATRTGKSKWITGDASRADAKRARSKCDAVLVGAGTVKADDPQLDGVLRVIVDGKLSCGVKAKVFRDENVFVACSGEASAAAKARYVKAGVKFKSFGKKSVDLQKLLEFLGEKGVQSVFVEGGASVHGGFVDNRLVDRVLLYVAPKIIGGKGAISFIGGFGVDKLKDALCVEDLSIRKIGEDLKIEGVVMFF